MIRTMEKADVMMKDWNILQFTLEDGTLSEHFIGYSVTDRLGRLSTRIQLYDEKSATGATSSGSTYEMIGPPGRPHDDAIYVLETQIGAARVKQLLSGENYNFITFKYPIE